jgi:hypothetical protein
MISWFRKNPLLSNAHVVPLYITEKGVIVKTPGTEEFTVGDFVKK